MDLSNVGANELIKEHQSHSCLALIFTPISTDEWITESLTYSQHHKHGKLLLQRRGYIPKLYICYFDKTLGSINLLWLTRNLNCLIFISLIPLY